jgi:hypothetical protein
VRVRKVRIGIAYPSNRTSGQKIDVRSAIESAAPSSLPNPITRLPQGNAQLDFHVSGPFEGHGVVHLVEEESESDSD